MLQYIWEIESVDTNNGTMVVSYTFEDKNVRYNVPIPDQNSDLETWVDGFAPKNEWTRYANNAAMDVRPGMTGVCSFSSEEEKQADPSTTPNVVGSWNEEYIRALIYSVFEEMRENAV